MTYEKEAVLGVFTVAGFNFGGRGQASGMVFVRMKDWKDRPGRKNRVQAIAQRAKNVELTNRFENGCPQKKQTGRP